VTPPVPSGATRGVVRSSDGGLEELEGAGGVGVVDPVEQDADEVAPGFLDGAAVALRQLDELGHGVVPATVDRHHVRPAEEQAPERLGLDPHHRNRYCRTGVGRDGLRVQSAPVKPLGTPIEVPRVTMARAAAVLFGTGGALALFSLAVPHWHIEHPTTAALIAAPALPTAAVLLLLAGHVPERAIHALLVLGTVQLSVALQFLGPGASSATAGSFYAWIAIFAFYFLPRRAALLHLAFMGLAFTVALWAQHAEGGPAQWLVTMGTATAGGLVVGSLVGRLRAMAGTDVLTGLANRRSWELTLERELARAWRQHSPVAIAVIDLDDFKALNDRRGHLAGDRLLKELSAAWGDVIREEDVLARPGGDEFGIVLPDCGQEQAGQILDRLRAKTPAVTFSAGLASWDGSEQAGSLLERADIALYRAKNRGGNHTVIAGAPGG
jgi:diguanylate cyclase (GGDEF)-like protein